MSDTFVANAKTKDPVPPLRPEADTLPKLFLLTAKRLGSAQVAMRKKRFGIWQEYSWADSLRNVQNFCLGMVELGLQRGEKVCIIGDNDPEYFWAELAIQSGGGATIGIFSDATPRELDYLINNSESTYVIAHDQEQVDKLFDIQSEIPNVRKIIYWDNKGMRNYQQDNLLSFEDVIEIGAGIHAKNPNRYTEIVTQGSGDDVAVLSYTSGTTSLPKGAMISHANLYYGSQVANQILPLYQGDDYVSFSPLAWITEQSLGLANHVIIGTVVNFPEQAATVQNDIREIAPTMFLFPSRLWESMVRQVQANIVDSDIINRTLYKMSLQVGYKMADFEEEGVTPPATWRFLNYLSDLATFAPLRDKLGLSRLRFAYTSGAAISPDILRFFRAINVDLHQLYGSTECQAHTIHFPNDIKLGTVGRPLPTIDIEIRENSEIYIKSRSVFQGYFKDEEKTAEALQDGWFRTGDAGYFDKDGHLIYLDRVKDLIELASGDHFSPQYIEGRLKFSPYIHDVMAVGGEIMPYVAALITIDFENVARWAEKQGLNFTTMVDLSQRDEVAQLITADIERVNEGLTPAGQVRRYVIMPRSFDADESELTRTRKIRRRYMAEKYGDVLQTIYLGQANLALTAEVQYRDGRIGQTETLVMVRTLANAAKLPIVDLRQAIIESMEDD